MPRCWRCCSSPWRSNPSTLGLAPRELFRRLPDDAGCGDAIRCVRASARTNGHGGGLAAAVAIAWGRHVSGENLDTALSIALSALISLFDWAAVWVILRDLFRRQAVGAENVLGAICGYVIAGDAWAGVNDIAYLALPAAYSINPEIIALLADWHGRHALFAYYGFAQMLTIGYADVTPVRAPATTLNLLGALFGVFYTAVVVSQLVHLAQSGKRSPDDG